MSFLLWSQLFWEQVVLWGPSCFLWSWQYKEFIVNLDKVFWSRGCFISLLRLKMFFFQVDYMSATRGRVRIGCSFSGLAVWNWCKNESRYLERQVLPSFSSPYWETNVKYNPHELAVFSHVAFVLVWMLLIRMRLVRIWFPALVLGVEVLFVTTTWKLKYQFF